MRLPKEVFELIFPKGIFEWFDMTTGINKEDTTLITFTEKDRGVRDVKFYLFSSSKAIRLEPYIAYDPFLFMRGIHTRITVTMDT